MIYICKQIYIQQIDRQIKLIDFQKQQETMKINDSKQKRMYIMEQISNRQHSRQKERKSSAERRRKIQNDLDDFVKTMTNISYNKMHTQQMLNRSHNNYYSPIQQLPPRNPKQQLKLQYDAILRSPSFQNIQLQINQIQKSLTSNNNNIQQKYQNDQNEFSIRNNKENQQNEQRKIKQNLGENDELKKQKIEFNWNQENRMKRNDGNSIEENQSSGSAIFFTSKFNQYLNNNQNFQNRQTNNKSPSKPQSSRNQLLQLHQVPVDIKLQNQQQQLKPFNQQSNTISHNTNLISNPSQQILPPQVIINHFPDTIEQQHRQSRLLMKNKSGHSLALSNQSSLKYSLYESNFKEILNHKLTNQLIADTKQFQQNQNGRGVGQANYLKKKDNYLEDNTYLSIKIQMIAQSLLNHEFKHVYKDFLSFGKLYELSTKVKNRQKKQYFQAFQINQQLNFQQKKNQIKCNHYLQNKQHKLTKSIFKYLKKEFYQLYYFKINKADQFRQQKDQILEQKVFRYFKISWFDQKVKKQIELYYLSKLFAHFIKAIKTEKQINRNKCLSHYCYNLKKRYFKFFVQGINKTQSQRIVNQNAHWHFAFNLQRKVFDAWKDRLSYKDRYISLAMTTKNTFKQTANHKWMQIKTVDFKQIKN